MVIFQGTEQQFVNVFVKYSITINVPDACLGVGNQVMNNNTQKRWRYNECSLSRLNTSAKYDLCFCL